MNAGMGRSNAIKSKNLLRPQDSRRNLLRKKTTYKNINGQTKVRPIDNKLHKLAPDVLNPSEASNMKSSSARAEPRADTTRTRIQCLSALEIVIADSLIKRDVAVIFLDLTKRPCQFFHDFDGISGVRLCRGGFGSGQTLKRTEVVRESVLADQLGRRMFESRIQRGQLQAVLCRQVRQIMVRDLIRGSGMAGQGGQIVRDSLRFEFARKAFQRSPRRRHGKTELCRGADPQKTKFADWAKRYFGIGG